MRLALAAAVVLLPLAASGSSQPRLLARIATGNAPCGAVAAFGSVWVANDGGSLVRINPARNRVVRRIQTGRGSCSLTAGAGALWIANYKRGLIRILPRSGRVTRISVGAIPFDVIFAFNRIWVTAWEAGRLTVVDPRTLRVTRRIDVGPRPMGLLVKNGAIWVGFGRESAIARIDPANGSVESIPVGEWAPGWFVDGTNDLWIQAEGGHLVQVDPASRSPLAHMHFGRTLAQGAAAPDGTIWMPDKEQSRVFRIDQRRPRVLDDFAAGRGAYLALRAYGSMWVTSYAGSEVWRFRP